MEEKVNAPETQEQRERRWRNTRWMAWLTLLAGIFFPLLLVFTENSHLPDITVPFYGFAAAVVGFYIGFSTTEDKWRK